MTIKDIENAGYKVFKTGDHSYDLYEGFAYHGVIIIDGKKKFFKVTLIEDCPLYNVKVEVKTIEDIAECLKEYFPVDCSHDNHYYDMYNVQIRNRYRVDSFVYGIIKDYGFKAGCGYQWDENVMSYYRQIGNKKSLHLDIDTKEFKMRAWFGDYSWTEADFKMWDVESVKNAIAQVLLVPIVTEVGPGFDLLTKIPVQTETASIGSVDPTLLSMLGGGQDDIKEKLESAKANIEKLLETL